MIPNKGLYSFLLMSLIFLLDAPGQTVATRPAGTNNPAPSAAVKNQIEILATEAVNQFTAAVKTSNAAKNNLDSARAELRAVTEMSATIKKLQVLADKDGSLSSMATMQGVIGLQSALVNYAIYDMTLDEDILATGRRSAENAMHLLAASIELSKEEASGVEKGSLPDGKEQL